ncbi:pth11-like integral membrane protein [Colletotrichum higginsianum]|nr:pth11-like integral membrane protein [Colletotrichum higginsianum]
MSAANPDAPLTGAAQTIDRQTLTAIIWICFSVASLFVALRLAVRWRQNRSLLADDYCILWAWACLLTMSALQTRQLDALYYTTHLAAGRIPVTAEAGPMTEELTRWQFPIIKLFWTVLWSVKASFMALFYRLVRPFAVRRRLWYCVAVFASLAYVGCWLASTLTCSPPSDYFRAGKCNSPHEIWMQTFNVLYSTAVDIASDLMIMALPLTVLPSLQLDARRKVGLGVAFSLAVIIICVAVVRMTQIVRGGTVDLVGLAIWGAVETATAVVVGSLPPLKALLTRGVRKYHSSAKKPSQRYYAGGGHGSVPGTTAGGAGGGGGVGGGGYGPDTRSRSVMVTESIPLDDMHRSSQMDGRIYVQRTYETHVEHDNSSREGDDDDEAAIVKGKTKAWAA